MKIFINKKLLCFLGCGLACSSAIVIPIVHKNYKFGEQDRIFKGFLLNMMKDVDNDFFAKYGNYIDQALSGIIKEYDGPYKNKLKEAIEKIDIKKINQVWSEVRDLFIFMYERNDHKSSDSNNSNLDPELKGELCKFIIKTKEHDMFLKDKKWYLDKINKFLLFYDNKEKELLLKIMKKLNSSTTIKQLYNDMHQLFDIWSYELIYFIDNY